MAIETYPQVKTPFFTDVLSGNL